MTTCIACGSTEVEAFLDLGESTLANKFLRPQDIGRAERRYPLVVGFCQDCAHVQLTQRVSPSEMFDDYLYISSMSTTLVEHLRSLAQAVTQRFKLGRSDLLVDVGSNDGTLLQAAKELGVRTIGVDPAKNLAPLAAQRGITTLTAYFGVQAAREVVANHGQAAVVTATNVFPHIPLLDDFIDGLRELLRPDGVFVAEAHYLGDLLEQCAFDTIYHEHCSYWSLTSAMKMFRARGFEVFHAERRPIHHGQIRLFVNRTGQRPIDPSVPALLADEGRAGLTRIETFHEFARRVAQIREDLRATILRMKKDGRQVVGYGAPAKGNTLLTYLDLGPEQLDYIADKSPLKQGRVTPGTHIPVVGPERLAHDQPDYCLLLAWNFSDEILSEQQSYRAAGGKFVLPVPTVAIV